MPKDDHSQQQQRKQSLAGVKVEKPKTKVIFHSDDQIPITHLQQAT
jgi:hypothetical protein